MHDTVPSNLESHTLIFLSMSVLQIHYLCVQNFLKTLHSFLLLEILVSLKESDHFFHYFKMFYYTARGIK